MTAAQTTTAELGGTTDPKDLSRPFYGAPFSVAVKRFFRQFTTFRGRASRSEYWWAMLAQALLQAIASAIFLAGFIPAVSWNATHTEKINLGTAEDPIIYEQNQGIANAPTAFLWIIGLILMLVIALALILPVLAVTVRRLHDANLTGWLALLVLVAQVIVMVLCLLPSKVEGRRFDDAAPRGAATA